MDPAEHPQRGFGFLLKDVVRLMGRNFERRIAPLGMTQSQWRALLRLARKEGVNQASLAEQLDIRPISMTQTIDRLQAAGLVERRPDPDDRRAVRLYLTEAARPLLRQIDGLIAATLEEALAGLSEAARHQLVEQLARIKENLQQVEAARMEGGQDE